jgi:hypothetical protein
MQSTWVVRAPSDDGFYRRGKASAGSDEGLIRDPRAEMTPAQMVESKLVSLLNGSPLPLSQVRMAQLGRDRGRDIGVPRPRVFFTRDSGVA